jgi:hypothetical protein
MNDKDNIIMLENEVLRLNGLIRVAKRERNDLQMEINSIYGDAMKYPQLDMPEAQLERLRRLVK